MRLSRHRSIPLLPMTSFRGAILLSCGLSVSWRLFLINRTTGAIKQLNPKLVGGAPSAGNPTVSFLTLPSGVPALVFTCFIFGTNNGATLPGGHTYVYPLQ